MRRDEVVGIIEAFAPLSLAEPWDNSGMLVEGKEIVTSLDVMLDPTLDALNSAHADMIVSHHPLFLSPLRCITKDMKQKLSVLLSGDRTFYAAHTTLDLAPNGVSWALAQRIGLKEDRNSSPLIRTGSVPYGSIDELIGVIRDRLGKRVVKVVGNRGSIGKVAAIPGSGFHEDTIEKCYDMGMKTIISGDLKHHPALKALDLGMTLIDAGHMETEVPGLEHFASYLDEQLEGVDIQLIVPKMPWDHDVGY
ncbi:MAG: Nif3-like dinuclear metal center hexameric protein [Candidatus Methanofastidiosa archaeon]|nr:Nif3-like dinuclear metal center hexameric protein [Candidatus Methanofastidiosa archaeon]